MRVSGNRMQRNQMTSMRKGSSGKDEGSVAQPTLTLYLHMQR